MSTNSVIYKSPSGVRKRKCDPGSWPRNIAKKACNLGQEYISRSTGQTIAGKKVGPPCQCAQRCFTLVGEESIAAIHNDYWTIGDHNLQTAFIHSCAVEIPVARHYTGNAIKQQAIRRRYQVKAGGKSVTICKEALANILGVGESRITRAVKKKTASGILIPDMRGRHNNQTQVNNLYFLFILNIAY